MATRNSASFVSDALDSVMAQGHQPAFVWVIDADSTDGTEDIVRRIPHVQLIRQTGTGLWQAWNQAIAQAHTPFIAILDSDDRWELDALSVHVTAFAHNPQAAVSIGRTRFFCDSKKVPAGVRPELLKSSHRGAIPGATLWRREVFATLGPFREDLTTTSDIEWFLRLRQSSLEIAEPEAVVLAKRIHSNSLGLSLMQSTTYDRQLINVARESIYRIRETTMGDVK
jgi:glycosyltransferase involved in cell wall biosynthesis